MLLKTRCIAQDDALRSAFGFHGVASSFFINIVGAIDCLMFAQINEEATACLEEGGPIRELLVSIVDDARDKGLSSGSIHAAVLDMQSLFQKRREFVVGSAYMDFVVSTYSAFELFMARIYDQLRLKHPSSGHRLKLLEKLIGKYNCTSEEKKEEVLARIAKVSDYVSGREKIEFVLSKLPKEGERDRAKDLLTVKFYSNTRNSIHNLGKSAVDLQYCSDGINLIHDTGAGVFAADRSDIVRLCGELVEIYRDAVAENIGMEPNVFLVVEAGFFEEEDSGE
ncbi:hypothetical protein WM29_21250 [Burkholderia ubonensis]|nr:hypothetical protein WM29_21250 [Burkholderia ubonensis]